MDITEFTDLEIGLYPQDKTTFRLAPRLSKPRQDAENRSSRSADQLVTIDADSLSRIADNKQYGRQLTECLFNEALTELFLDAYPKKAEDPPLRVRLFLSPDAHGLRRVKWETLFVPRQPEMLLATSGKVYFSRYQASQEVNVPHPGPLNRMRALVVIASPTDIVEKLEIPEIRVAEELEAAREALGDIPMQVLCREPQKDRAGSPTLKELLFHLGKNFDILYLVCHGAAGEGKPARIYLEDEQGEMAVVGVNEYPVNGVKVPGLIAQLQQLPYRPRLVVLSSCQSGMSAEDIDGKETGGEKGPASADRGALEALAALGPELVDIGVPAVIAMQDNVKMKTARQFMKDLFTDVRRHGEIDRAVAYARNNLVQSGVTDWHVPALLMNLRSGRLWYDPGFSDPEASGGIWSLLCQAIAERDCVPVIGSGMLEYLTGPFSDLARKWSLDKNTPYPLSVYTRSDLPRVARFLVTNLGREFTLRHFLRELRREIRKRNEELLKNEGSDVDLLHLFKLLGDTLRLEKEKDPFWVLAHLPARVYISATPDNLLFDALVEAGKKPRHSVPFWKTEVKPLHNPFDADYEPTPEKPLNPSYTPQVECPLVYHLFGHVDQRDSLVLNEDDFFDLFVWAIQDYTRGKESKIPLSLTRAISTGAMLLVGFQLEDWDTRVLLHLLSRLKQSAKIYPSVAVQVTPDETTFFQPRQARMYLEKYLNKFPGIVGEVYWGTAQDFLEKLWERNSEWEEE